MENPGHGSWCDSSVQAWCQWKRHENNHEQAWQLFINKSMSLQLSECIHTRWVSPTPAMYTEVLRLKLIREKPDCDLPVTSLALPSLPLTGQTFSWPIGPTLDNEQTAVSDESMTPAPACFAHSKTECNGTLIKLQPIISHHCLQTAVHTYTAYELPHTLPTI